MAINSINPQGNLVDADGKPAYAREVIPMRIQDEMRVSYTRYAMSVIVGRALPDVRDGLKPVHRRILYAMYDQNMTPDRRREKCASAVGEVLKKYHPHGDQSVYDALVRMAQDFSMRYRLVDGQGNFGCFTGDTRVLLLDGTSPTFEELAARPKDEIFPVYSVNSDGEIVVGEGRFSRVTRKAAPLVELTFDDGSTTRCTPDHKFMLRDGSWKEAATLTVDDSLMAGHFDNSLGDLRVRQPLTGEWQFVRGLIGDLFLHESRKAALQNGELEQSDKDVFKPIPTQAALMRTEAKRRGINVGLRKKHDDVASLQLKWREPDCASRVMRTKIAGFAAKLVALHGADSLSPQLYDESRDANWIPKSEKAVAYFGSFEALSHAAQTHNHRVVAVRHLEETCDVYDITVDKHHNFLLANGCVVHNSVDGDSAAAYRYTEARLAPLSMELMRDIEAETVDFGPNFSESTTEPLVFPSVYPNLLVNGSSGIAVGMATNIPPHNLGEVCDAVTVLIDKPDASIADLMAVCPGPDFPTAGLILGTKGANAAYHTGRGSVIMQARATIEPFDNGRSAIIITELPYQVNKATLIENIAMLAREKRIEGISELRDESDRQGMRIVMEIKRDANPNVVLNFLYKHTALRTSFGMNMLAIVDGGPKILTLKSALEAFVRHREDVITRRSKFQLRKAEARAHILEGLRAILASIDEVIALIRSSQSREDARNRLMNEGVPAYVDGVRASDGTLVTLSEIQANAVLDMRLGQLTQLDRRKIDEEYADLMKEIERLRGILDSPQKVRGIIKADMVRIKKDYGDPRRTQIIQREAQELKPEDLIAEEDVVVTITRDGYIKKLPKDTYNVQGRGGRGKVGLNKKEEDMIEHLFVCSTHHTLLIFTNRGKVYQLRAFEIPTASRQAKGTPIINLLQVEQGEYVTAALNIAEFSDDRFLFMVTRDGTVKKTAMSAYATKLSKGIIAINLEGSDELRFVFPTDGKKEIILASRQGMSVRFNEFPVESEDGKSKGGVKATGRNTSGVYGMRFKGEGDYIVGAVAADEETVMLTVSEKGLGKRTKIEDYRLTGRGGTGVITLKVNDKTGELVSLQSVKDDEELLIITTNGIVIRQRIDTIRETGRVAQGVKLINLDSDDKVAAVAKILQEPEGDDLDSPAQSSGAEPEIEVEETEIEA